MSTTSVRPDGGVRGWLAANSSGNVRAVLERGFRVVGSQNWAVVVSGFFEPVLYLLLILSTGLPLRIPRGDLCLCLLPSCPTS